MGLIRIFAFEDESYLASNALGLLNAKSSFSLLGSIPDPLTISAKSATHQRVLKTSNLRKRT